MNDTTLPDPLVSAEVDLRGLDYMPLFGNHLFGSEFNAAATDGEWRAAVTLWWAAWNQVPAGSLPVDDTALCRLADLGRDLKAWRKVKARALHGFDPCSDGRLYHRFVCAQALVAWDKRVKERDRKAKWRASRDAERDWDKSRPLSGQERGRDADVPADGKRRDGTGRDGTIRRKRLRETELVAGAAGKPPAAVASATRGTRLPSDWRLPKDWGDWALADLRGWTPETVRLESEKFADFWHAKTGKDATKADWLATWRNWCRNARPASNGGEPHRRTETERRVASIEALTGRNRSHERPAEAADVVDVSAHAVP